jgi:hypothetical protein
VVIIRVLRGKENYFYFFMLRMKAEVILSRAGEHMHLTHNRARLECAPATLYT